MLCKSAFVLFHTEVSSFFFFYHSWKSRLSFSSESVINSFTCEWQTLMLFFDKQLLDKQREYCHVQFTKENVLKMFMQTDALG